MSDSLETLRRLPFLLMLLRDRDLTVHIFELHQAIYALSFSRLPEGLRQ